MQNFDQVQTTLSLFKITLQKKLMGIKMLISPLSFSLYHRCEELELVLFFTSDADTLVHSCEQVGTWSWC